MTDLTTTRWTRYGKDRLYVKTSEGIDVASIDLVTGKVDVKVPEFGVEVLALASQQAPLSAPRAATSVSVSSVPPVEPVGSVVSEHVPDGYDLADNTAGAAARAKRQEVNGQAPVWNLVARVLGVKTDERAWRVGTKGEEKVGHELSKLPDGWHVLHAVLIGEHGSDIDHVVIGPRGVFTLNTKNHPDGSVSVYERALWVNGHSTDYLRNSRFEAERATKLLTTGCAMPVRVLPMIVFVDPAKLTRKGPPPDVDITCRRGLRTFLMQQPQRLTPSQVEHIFTVARNSLTWQST